MAMIQARPWPEVVDYQRTIRHPQHCFYAPELRTGTVKTDRDDLPIPMTGKSAVVFQLQTPSRAYAVRCFRRPVTSQKHRYEVLSRFLAATKLPSLVNCAHLEQGICVQGHPYPIVRMEWAAGDPLHKYVEAHVRQGSVLDQLAVQWRAILAGFRRVHMAHGDLQHDNILVDQFGKLWLVDYDGVYIRDLRQHPPDEKGHPNYQHPKRTRHDYSETIDAFSALVIYMSLIAVRADPGLWTSPIHTGDNLIFVMEDFEKPGQTPLWDRLKKSPDAEVQRLTGELESFCRGPVSAVRDLEEVLQGLRHPGPQPSHPATVQGGKKPSRTVTQGQGFKGIIKDLFWDGLDPLGLSRR